MADISKITLPSGTTYDIKDATARSQIADIIAAGLEYVIVTTLPTASASTKGKIYLVLSNNGTNDYYDEYLTVEGGQGSPDYAWEKIGNTDVDLSGYVTDVTLNKQTISVPGDITPSMTYLSGSASGGNVAWNSKDQKSAVTGYSPSTGTAVGTGATFAVTQPTITLTPNTTSGVSYVESVSVTSSHKLVTTSLRGVAGTANVSKVTAATSQTTADGTWTAVTGSNANSNLLANISVSGEVLSIGAATLDTQTTTQFTAQDKTVATANVNTTTVATGSIDATGTGSTVVTAVTPSGKKLRAAAADGSVAFDSTDDVSVITSLGTPNTANVIGAGSTFTVTQPTIALNPNEESGKGRAAVVSRVNVGTYPTVLTNATSLTVTRS